MVYLTFNDPPSGIYYSQVTDTCIFFERELKEDVKLVAFISFRGFFTGRKKISQAFPGSFVFPMFPGVKNWKKNRFLLSFFFLFHSTHLVIARGPFAAWLALRSKKRGRISKVCFDARGA